MSSASANATNSAGSLDLSRLPAELQTYIQTQVSAALAAAATPAAPKALTPAEQCAAFLSRAESALSGEKTISAGSRDIHTLILAILDILIDTAFPEDASIADAPPVPEAVSAPHTTNESAV